MWRMRFPHMSVGAFAVFSLAGCCIVTGSRERGPQQSGSAAEGATRPAETSCLPSPDKGPAESGRAGMEAAFRAGEAKEGDFLIYEVWDAKEPVVWLVLHNLTNEWRIVRAFEEYIVEMRFEDGGKGQQGQTASHGGEAFALLAPDAYCAYPLYFTQYAGRRVTLTAKVDVLYPASRRRSTHTLGPVEGFLPISGRNTLKRPEPANAPAPEKPGGFMAKTAAPGEEDDLRQGPKPLPEEMRLRLKQLTLEARELTEPWQRLRVMELVQKQLRENGYEAPPEFLETIRELREALEVPGDVGPR